MLRPVPLPSLADELDRVLVVRESERVLEVTYEVDVPAPGELRCCCGAPKARKSMFCTGHFSDPINARFWVGQAVKAG